MGTRNWATRQKCHRHTQGPHSRTNVTHADIRTRRDLIPPTAEWLIAAEPEHPLRATAELEPSIRTEREPTSGTLRPLWCDATVARPASRSSPDARSRGGAPRPLRRRLGALW